jgi:hypothetical protein
MPIEILGDKVIKRKYFKLPTSFNFDFNLKILIIIVVIICFFILVRINRRK